MLPFSKSKPRTLIPTDSFKYNAADDALVLMQNETAVS
jgi:hypothetical protein